MKDDTLYLTHILQAAEKILAYTSSGYDDFAKDAKTQDAVVRNFEIIGEAARKVSESTRQQNPDLPWKAMIGLRNILIHDYAGVDVNRVWQVVQHKLPQLLSAVSALLKRCP